MLLFVYGGIIIFGVNVMLMVVIGLMVGFVVYKFVCKLNCNKSVLIFLCVMIVDLVIYLIISV